MTLGGKRLVFWGGGGAEGTGELEAKVQEFGLKFVFKKTTFGCDNVCEWRL